MSGPIQTVQEPQTWDCSAMLVKSMGSGNGNTWAQTLNHHSLTVIQNNLRCFSEPVCIPVKADL